MMKLIKGFLLVVMLLSGVLFGLGTYNGSPSGMERVKLVECYIKGAGHPEEKYFCDFKRLDKSIYTTEMQRQGFRGAIYKVGTELDIYIDVPEYRHAMWGFTLGFIIPGLILMGLRQYNRRETQRENSV